MHARRCDVHLRSFTTGMVHPRARCPRITPLFFDERIRSRFSIGAGGPYVGVFFGDTGIWHSLTVFVIWDWINGSQSMVNIAHFVDCQTHFSLGPVHWEP